MGPVDIDEMGRVVAEKLARALAGRPVASEMAVTADVDIEAKYGAKLDRMLDGLAESNPNVHEMDDLEQ